MKRGQLWGPDFMRLGVWLEGPKLGGEFVFQSTGGETIRIGPLRRIVEFANGGFILWGDQGRRFEVVAS